MKKLFILFLALALVSSAFAFDFNITDVNKENIKLSFGNSNGNQSLADYSGKYCLEDGTNCDFEWATLPNISSVNLSIIGPWLYNLGQEVYYNETHHNESVISLIDVYSTNWMVASAYLYNDSDTIYFNETVLNNTIDARISNQLKYESEVLSLSIGQYNISTNNYLSNMSVVYSDYTENFTITRNASNDWTGGIIENDYYSKSFNLTLNSFGDIESVTYY